MIGILFLTILLKNMKLLESKYGKYKSDFFYKLNFNFESKKKILDIGCGDGIDAKIFINEFGLITHGIDIYKHDNIDKINLLDFKLASIVNLPYSDEEFDYIFLHDVLHHIDEKNQSKEIISSGLNEVKRIVKKNGIIIIVESNRYNPLSYFWMVCKNNHNHFRQSLFKKIINSNFSKTEFYYFEAHNYPFGKNIWIIYEFIMENIMPKYFISYNVAISKK